MITLSRLIINRTISSTQGYRIDGIGFTHNNSYVLRNYSSVIIYSSFKFNCSLYIYKSSTLLSIPYMKPLILVRGVKKPVDIIIQEGSKAITDLANTQTSANNNNTTVTSSTTPPPPPSTTPSLPSNTAMSAVDIVFPRPSTTIETFSKTTTTTTPTPTTPSVVTPPSQMPSYQTPIAEQVKTPIQYEVSKDLIDKVIRETTKDIEKITTTYSKSPDITEPSHETHSAIDPDDGSIFEYHVPIAPPPPTTLPVQKYNPNPEKYTPLQSKVTTNNDTSFTEQIKNYAPDDGNTNIVPSTLSNDNKNVPQYPPEYVTRKEYLEKLEKYGFINEHHTQVTNLFYDYWIQKESNGRSKVKVSNEDLNTPDFKLGMLKIYKDTELLIGLHLHIATVYIVNQDQIIIFGYLTSQNDKTTFKLTKCQPFSDSPDKPQYLKTITPKVASINDIENLSDEQQTIADDYLKNTYKEINTIFQNKIASNVTGDLNTYDGKGITLEDIKQVYTDYEKKQEKHAKKLIEKYKVKLRDKIDDTEWLDNIRTDSGNKMACEILFQFIANQQKHETK